MPLQYMQQPIIVARATTGGRAGGCAGFAPAHVLLVCQAKRNAQRYAYPYAHCDIADRCPDRHAEGNTDCNPASLFHAGRL